MKRFSIYLLLLGLIFSGSISYAQKIQILQGEQSMFTITHNDYSSLKIKNVLAGINHFTTETKEGQFTKLTVPGYGSSKIIGDPNLPVLRKIIEIPLGAEFEIYVLQEKYIEVDLEEKGINYKLFPTQPSLFKNIDNPEDVEFIINKSTYLSNSWVGSDIAEIKHLGQMRGTNLARLDIAMIQYNPALNKIKICTELELEVQFIGGDINKTISLKKELFSPYFNSIFQSISNYKNEITDELISDEPVTYVIISDPLFQSTLQPFIEWKTKKGFYVIEAYTDNPAVGSTTTSIKSYLQNLYDNPATGVNPQSFVLFVGDIAEIPAFSGTSGGHYTDLYYCDYTGDIYPECYYGRFSASSVAELQPQIDKTLEYEQYLMPDPTFLDQALMVAGDDESYEDVHGNGQINYGTTYYFNLAHGINSHTFLQDPPTGNAAIHDSIIDNVNKGITFGNYTAHCGSSGWGTPSFSTSDIAGLTNAHKYPLLVGNCCLSNKFDVDDCFGEELLQAVDKGAIGYIGGSNNTQWDEDFWWGVGSVTPATNPVYNSNNLGAYDRTFHDNGEPLSEWYVTQGQMPSAGNLAVTQAGGNEIYYWEIYHLMGDPSVMIYMSQPPVTNVSYDTLMPLGVATFTINTDPYAYVGISLDGTLHGAGIANAVGFVEVTMNPPITVPGIADIVVTRQNGQPFMGTVTVEPPSGPYLSLESLIIDDIAGNNNGEADYNEDIILDISLENIGSSLASNVSAVLSSSDPYVTVTDNTQAWSDIPAGSTLTQTAAFAFTVSNNVPDQNMVEFELETTDGAETWNITFHITVMAPTMEFGSMVVDDAVGGDGNGMLDPGETANIILESSNNGHSLSPLANASLNSASSWITLNTSSFDLGQIASSSTANASFSVTVSPIAPIGTSVDLNFDLVAGNYGTSKSFVASIGLMIEDWETGDFTKYPWILGGDAGWSIVSTDPYEGTYCSKSDTITHSQVSEMELNVDVASAGTMSFYRKVSSESGFDYLKFFIDGILMDEWAGEIAWGEVGFLVSAGNHTFKWQYFKDSSVSNGSDCAWVDYIIFPHPVPALVPPYQTNFDETGSIPDKWYNSSDDDFNWTLNSGPTGSTGTGPSGDHTSGEGYYMYIESSSPNYPGLRADLISPTFDLSSFSDVVVRFWYHMYGADMGDLNLDVYHNDSWIIDVMTPISGDQGDQWYEHVVDLTAYAGEIIQIRFRGITGISYTSDIAIDDFSIDGTTTGTSVDLTAFLEGPFVYTEMSTTLNSSGYIPLNQPYNVAPWNYIGTESVTSLPNTDIVDWVLLELRDAPGDATTATQATFLEYQPAFIMKDGSIVGLDGISYPILKNTVNNNLFVVVHHRNHIQIMSSIPIPNVDGIYNYNFTGSESTVFGGSSGYVEIEPGIWAMVAGDGLCDGIISMDDKTIIWKAEAGSRGYHSGDFDMNGNINNKDKNGYWRLNIGSYSQEP